MSHTVADLGEDRLLGRILPILQAAGHSEGVTLGPGDDAAVVASDVVTTDILIEGRDFRRHWSDGHALGIKAAAQNLADVAAMGARPVGLVLALGLPDATEVEWVERVCRGLAEEAARAGCSVVGGDLSGASEVILSVTALGSLDGGQAVRRSGARPGDVVALAGTVGRASAGLAALLAADEAGGQPEASAAALVRAQLAPRPPYDAGVAAARAGAHAMIDASDGLVQDLGRIAAASGVAIDLDATAPALVALTKEIGAASDEPWRHVLGGGEDHGLLACFGGSVPVGWDVIGRVGEGAGVSLAGVTQDPAQGFSHFSGET